MSEIYDAIKDFSPIDSLFIPSRTQNLSLFLVTHRESAGKHNFLNFFNINLSMLVGRYYKLLLSMSEKKTD